MSGVQIAEVTHFYDRIGVAVLALTDAIRVGDMIHVLGRTTDFQQEVKSLQIEHREVSDAVPGQDVALKVVQRVRPHDKVFKITLET